LHKITPYHTQVR